MLHPSEKTMDRSHERKVSSLGPLSLRKQGPGEEAILRECRPLYAAGVIQWSPVRKEYLGHRRGKIQQTRCFLRMVFHARSKIFLRTRCCRRKRQELCDLGMVGDKHIPGGRTRSWDLSAPTSNSHRQVLLGTPLPERTRHRDNRLRTREPCSYLQNYRKSPHPTAPPLHLRPAY